MVLPILPTGSEGDASLPGAAASYEDQLRKQQEDALRQHEEYRAQLELAQQQVAAKQGDLDLGQRLLQATDPSVPKPARDFLFAEISQRVGVDPKGEYSKQVRKLFTSLDPQSLEALRTTFSEQLKSSPPGQVNETVKAIMNGQMSGSAMLGMVRNAGLQQGTYQAAESPTTVGSQQARPLPTGAGEAITGSATTETMAGGPAQDRILRGDIPSPGAAPTLPSVESGEATAEDLAKRESVKPLQKDVEEGNQPIDKRAMSLMRKSTEGDVSVSEFNKQVGTNVGGPEYQKKLADFETKQGAMASTLSKMTELHKILDNPAAVGAGGWTAEKVNNLAGNINGVVSYFKGLRTPEQVSADSQGTAELNAAAEKAASRVFGSNLDAEAKANATSLMLDLSYMAMRQAGQGGQAGSNKDQANFLAQLGDSTNTKTAQNTLEGVMKRSFEGLTTEGNQLLGAGGKYKPNLDSLNEKQLEDIAKRAPSKEIAQAAGDASQIKKGTYEGQKDKMKDPGLEQRRENIRQESATKEAGQRQEAQERLRRSLIEDYKLKGEEADRLMRQLQMQASAEQSAAALEETKRHHGETEAHAKRQEERQRRKDIQEVFSNLGTQIARAFGGSIHFPAVNLGSGEQDASAFVYRRPERRQAPKVGR